MSDHLSPLTIERLGDGEWPGDAQSDAHLAACAACAGAVLSIVQMKRAIAALPRHAPRRRPAIRPRRTAWLALAAAIGTIAIVSAFTLTYLRSRDAARELIDMHATIIASAQPVDVVSTDRHTVKPWFEGRVPFAVEVPDLAATPFRVTGGRVVFWRGKPGAYLLITKAAHRISVFVFSADDMPRVATPSQVTMVTWRQNGLAYVAIGGIPRAELEQLKETFSSPLRFSRHAQSTLRRSPPSRNDHGLRRPDGHASL